MKVKFIEATSPLNWGKFMISGFDTEWSYHSAVDDLLLLRARGWGPEHLLVTDLQTGEGAIFAARPSGLPAADLNKHKIWVCPMFEPFLTWLYKQDLTDLDALPATVDFPDEPGSWAGYRREGQRDDDPN